MSNRDIWGIFEAIIFPPFFLQNAIAAELAASQMISLGTLLAIQQQQITYSLRHTYTTGHTQSYDNLPLTTTDK